MRSTQGGEGGRPQPNYRAEDLQSPKLLSSKKNCWKKIDKFFFPRSLCSFKRVKIAVDKISKKCRDFKNVNLCADGKGGCPKMTLRFLVLRGHLNNT